MALETRKTADRTPYQRNPIWLGSIAALALLLAWSLQATLGSSVIPRSWLAWIVAVLLAAVWAGLAYFSHLFLLTIGLATVAFFLRDAAGASLSVLGVILWWSGAALAFSLVATFYARYLLPKPGEQGAGTALRLISEHVAGDGPRGNQFRVRPVNLPTSFARYGVGMVESHQALVVRNNGQVASDIEPGFVMLRPRQEITDVVELRPFYRTQDVDVTTRDGIALKTSVAVRFRIRQPAHVGDPDLPFPYDRNAIFDAFYAATINDADQLVPWHDRVAPRAAALVVEELSRHTFDTLFDVGARDETPLADAREAVQRRLSELFATQGVQIEGVSIGRIHFPDDVMKQRVDQWQKQWEARIQTRQAGKAGSAIRPIDPETARIQMQVVAELVDNVEQMRHAGDSQLTDEIADQLIDMLRQAATEGTMRVLIPPPPDKKE